MITKNRKKSSNIIDKRGSKKLKASDKTNLKYLDNDYTLLSRPKKRIKTKKYTTKKITHEKG